MDLLLTPTQRSLSLFTDLCCRKCSLPSSCLFLSVQSDWNRWKVFPEFRGLKEAQDKSSKQLSASETREMSKLTRAVSQRQPFTSQTLDTRRIAAPNIVINPYFWLIMLACCYLLMQSLTLKVLLRKHSRKIRSGRQDSEEKRKCIYKDSNLSGLYLLTDKRPLWVCLYNSNLILRAQINTLITAVTWTTYQWWVIGE